MRKWVKLSVGVGLLLIGLFTTVVGVATLALVGPDGTFTLPTTSASAPGAAIVLDQIDPSALPGGHALSITLDVSVTGRDGPVFLGVGPASSVASYLSGVQVDQVVQIEWPGSIRTAPIVGSRTPDPPADQSFWIASGDGPTASLSWDARPGDWTLVVMNADGANGVDVTGGGSITVPVLGPVGIIATLVGVGMLVTGTLLAISGAKMPPAMSAHMATG